VKGLFASVGRLASRPTGVTGRHRPFYFLNLVERLRGSMTLEATVAERITLITGASSGIGAATARRIGAAGGTVLLVARTSEKLEEVAAEVARAGGTAHAHPCDLSDLDDIERLADEVLARHGRVDILVNNAGHSIRRSIDLSYERIHDFERTMRLNYLAPVRLILALLPGMRERGFGHIVNVSSAGVQTRTPRFSAYVGSKAALDAFTECIAAEVGPDGVRLTTVHMPLVRTPMIEPTTIYRSFPAITPDEAAERIADGIVYKPNRIGTPVGNLAAVTNALSPTTLDIVRSAGYQLFPDSAAASGKDGDDEEISGAGEVFARILRGVHW
jgi:NAD(P)-dependent dehydrogenase (short-subunit alcohol dehydrogenase family)